MNKTKAIFVTGFALFSMFFGAGNLILPPFLGVQSGESWSLVTFGFFVTAVLIPIFGIIAHARLQGTMFDFGKKVSPTFSAAYCVIVYIICVTLPAPRTASVTHEMAIAPFLGTSSLLTSSIYFALVFVFVMNRSKILDIMGKFLTPFIIIILLAVIFVGITTTPESIPLTIFNAPFVSGLIEGYQTFDAIGAIVVGGVLVISMNFNNTASFAEKKELISKAGIVAGIGLLIIYAGLIYTGMVFSDTFNSNATRTEILSGLSTQTLGSIGTTFLSVLVALACFTTGVGIITGTSDYFKGLFNNSQKAYTITAIFGCVLGVLMGQLDVQYIIKIALPALMFIYPITIVLILLNVLSDRWASGVVFKSVVFITFLFSIPDFLGLIITSDRLHSIQSYIPLSEYSLGWLIPAFLTFSVFNLKKIKN